MLIKTKYIESKRAEMLRFITNTPKTSLEVGCRGATHSKLLKDTFDSLETWGIEPETAETLVNEAKINLDVFINDYLHSDTKHLPKKYFDLIVFNDVLEHMYDPWEVLIASRNLLAQDGIVVISLPNMRHKSILKNLLLNDSFEYKEEGLTDITHIRFFTKKTILKMMEECGYEIIKFESIFPEKKRFFRQIFNFLTNNRFATLNVFQFGITAKSLNLEKIV